MAKAVGMKKAWFQDRPFLPHYDLVASRRAKAVELGAVEVTLKELVTRVRHNREVWKQARKMLTRLETTKTEVSKRSKDDPRKFAAGTALSPSQKQILEVLCEAGGSNEVIGKRLGITVGTVKSQMSHIMQKTGYATRTELVALELHKRYAAGGAK